MMLSIDGWRGVSASVTPSGTPRGHEDLGPGHPDMDGPVKCWISDLSGNSYIVENPESMWSEVRVGDGGSL